MPWEPADKRPPRRNQRHRPWSTKDPGHPTDGYMITKQPPLGLSSAYKLSSPGRRDSIERKTSPKFFIEEKNPPPRKVLEDILVQRIAEALPYIAFPDVLAKPLAVLQEENTIPRLHKQIHKLCNGLPLYTLEFIKTKLRTQNKKKPGKRHAQAVDNLNKRLTARMATLADKIMDIHDDFYVYDEHKTTVGQFQVENAEFLSLERRLNDLQGWLMKRARKLMATHEEKRRRRRSTTEEDSSEDTSPTKGSKKDSKGPPGPPKTPDTSGQPGKQGPPPDTSGKPRTRRVPSRKKSSRRRLGKKKSSRRRVGRKRSGRRGRSPRRSPRRRKR